MLGIHGVGWQRADYYLSDLAAELPVSEPGRWAGRAGAGLGRVGPLGRAGFDRRLHGSKPRTGSPIGSGRITVVAFDLTFSAPKSASVLFALGGEAATALRARLADRKLRLNQAATDLLRPIIPLRQVKQARWRWRRQAGLRLVTYWSRWRWSVHHRLSPRRRAAWARRCGWA